LFDAFLRIANVQSDAASPGVARRPPHIRRTKKAAKADL
jgi:hypothetical protein